MKNVTIEKVNNGFIEYYCVVADTKRFGEGEVMFQGRLEECKKYIKSFGIKLSECKNYNSFCTITLKAGKLDSSMIKIEAGHY